MVIGNICAGLGKVMSIHVQSRINIVMPGFVETEDIEGVSEMDDDSDKDEFLDQDIDDRFVIAHI
jgi:hypothetical protein